MNFSTGGVYLGVFAIVEFGDNVGKGTIRNPTFDHQSLRRDGMVYGQEGMDGENKNNCRNDHENE